MLRFQAVVLTGDVSLRQSVRRLATAIGATVECMDLGASVAADRPVDLVIVDARTGPPAAAPAVPAGARVLYLVDGARLAEYLPLLSPAGTVGLLAAEGGLEEDVFIATATKALRGEIFGLEKYFPWGVTTFAIDVCAYEQKERALEILLEHATLAGCRWALRERIQVAGDELLMNALYHGPVDEQGRRLHEGKTVKELAHLPSGEPVVLRYGCSGRHFGVSVQDGYGSLSRETLLSYLSRTGEGGGAIESKPTGAGLGLASVLRSANRLIFNLQASGGTEVIALFDRDARAGAQSLCLFEVPAPTEEEEAAAAAEDGQDEAAPAPAGRWPWSRGRVAAALILTATVAGLCGVYAAHRLHPQPNNAGWARGLLR